MRIIWGGEKKCLIESFSRALGNVGQVCLIRESGQIQNHQNTQSLDAVSGGRMAMLYKKNGGWLLTT